MKTEEITKSNALIAEFMGVHITPDGLRRNVMNKSFYLTELQYHTSFDWIMPVVEKIEELEGIERVDIFYKNCQITYSDEDNEYLRGGKDCRGIKGETKLLAVYYAVLEFITWFNTITPNIYYED